MSNLSSSRSIVFRPCFAVELVDNEQQIRAKAAERGAKRLEISVDCVAYAPHRKIDVQDWDVDYAVFTFYKVG